MGTEYFILYTEDQDLLNKIKDYLVKLDESYSRNECVDTKVARKQMLRNIDSLLLFICRRTNGRYILKDIPELYHGWEEFEKFVRKYTIITDQYELVDTNIFLEDIEMNPSNGNDGGFTIDFEQDGRVFKMRTDTITDTYKSNGLLFSKCLTY